MTPGWQSWTGLVYYGEAVGFVLAWIAGGAALLLSTSTPEPVEPPVDRVAVAPAADSAG